MEVLDRAALEGWACEGDDVHVDVEIRNNRCVIH
jgi:hypothetical protein